MFSKLYKLFDKKIDQNSITKEVFDLRDVQDSIIERNQDQMYDLGISSKGKSLGEYAPKTIEYKKKKGQRYDHVTLKDTGEFYSSFKILSSETNFTIIAYTIKQSWDEAIDLNAYYPNILGLTDENIAKIQEKILPILRKKVKETILG